jgi:protein-tyrosine phosphatase
VIATDAHNLTSRPPLLAEGRDAAARWVGTEEAERMVTERPRAVLENWAPGEVIPALAFREPTRRRHRRGWLARLWSR